MTIGRDPLSYSMPTAINVRNATGSALPSGTLVYINGYHTASGNVTVAAADADGTIGTQVAEMILPATIANGANGIAYRTSLLDGTLDTSGAALGDPVYLSTTAGTPTLTPPTTAASVRQIVGRVVVLGSSTTNGRVLYHFMTPASVQALSTTNLQANSVTAAKMTTTSATGTLQFPLANARAISSSQIGIIAVGGAGTVGSGGILGSDGSTAPKLIRRNVGTDPTLDINWPAAVVTEVAWDFVVPADMDVTAASTVKVLASMSAGNDTPVVAVKLFTGVGGANLGGNTAALGSAESTATATIAGNSFTLGQQGILTLVPAAHATDAVRVRGVSITYTRV